MITAPPSDFTFSQRPLRAVRAFFFPRACETTLTAMDDERIREGVASEVLPTARARARVRGSSGENGRGGVPSDRHAPSLRTAEAIRLLQVLVHQLRHLEH